MSTGVGNPKESVGLGVEHGAGVAKCDNPLSSFIIIHEKPVVTFTAGFVVGTGDSASSQEASVARLMSFPHL